MKKTFHWPPGEDPPGLRWVWGFHRKADDKSPKWIPGEMPGFEFSMPIVLGLLRKGERFSPPLANSEVYPLIGAVALNWGYFEVHMNSLLASFVAADGDQHDRGWERRNFTKRSALLKTKAKARFPGRISEEITAILEAAAVYHWQRNLMVHGQVYAHFRGPLPPIAVAKGRVNGRDVEYPLEPEFIEQMYHELGMLTGRISDLTTADAKEICRLASRCRSRLRAFVEKHPVTPPTPQNMKPRHPPLQALSHPRRKGDAAVTTPLKAKIWN